MIVSKEIMCLSHWFYCRRHSGSALIVLKVNNVWGDASMQEGRICHTNTRNLVHISGTQAKLSTTACAWNPSAPTVI